MKNKAIKNTYNFMVIFDVENDTSSNETIDNTFIVQQIKKYIESIKNNASEYEIYTEEKHREKMEKTYKSFVSKKKKNKRQRITPERQVQKWMCKHYFDVRAFGANIIVGDNPGGLMRGPVQLSQIKSADTDNQNHLSYTLYKIGGLASAVLAGKTGFSDDDLELLWQAIENMFGHNGDIAEKKGITVRKLIVFKHKSSLGNALAHKLFECVKITRKDTSSPAKKYSDYDISIDYGNFPANIEICEKI